MQRVADPFEQLSPQWPSARRAGRCRGSPTIVKAMVRSCTTGARLKIDARRRAIPRQPWIASAACSPGCSCRRSRKPLAIFEREALVGTLVTEASALWLEADEIAGTIGLPRAGHDVGRAVDPRVVDGRDGGELRRCHETLSTSSANADRRFRAPAESVRECSKPYTRLSSSARHEASMMLGLTPIVVHVRSPLVASISTRVIAPVAVAPSRMRTL